MRLRDHRDRVHLSATFVYFAHASRSAITSAPSFIVIYLPEIHLLRRTKRRTQIYCFRRQQFATPPTPPTLVVMPSRQLRDGNVY